MTTAGQCVLAIVVFAAGAVASGATAVSQAGSDSAAPASRPAGPSVATGKTEPLDAAHRAAAEKLINGGVRFLLARQEPAGGWSMRGGLQRPAVTALVLKALLQHPDYDNSSPRVRRGFGVLLGHRQADGGVYNPKIGYANYSSSLALMALSASGDPRYNQAAGELIAYLRGIQIQAGSVTPKGRRIGKDHRWIGGTSYGKHGRPDGSNVAMWTQAMHEAGVKGDDPAMKRMLGFFSRLQNSSETNPAVWAQEGPNDGGFIYALGHDAPETKAGAGPGGRGLRSYGSITYMGFMSMLYAGLAREDPRVRAAYKWIRRYWTLDGNPNMPGALSQQGLYYYYHVYAKALRAWGEPIITDVKGVRHNWRHELIDALGKRVGKDGAWVNAADRWNEGSRMLVTSYSVLALQEAIKK